MQHTQCFEYKCDCHLATLLGAIQFMFATKNYIIAYLVGTRKCMQLEHSLRYCVDVVKVDSLAFQKISKRHFLRDIEKSFQ